MLSLLKIGRYYTLTITVTPRNNSPVEKDRYLYGFGDNNSKTFILKTSKWTFNIRIEFFGTLL